MVFSKFFKKDNPPANAEDVTEQEEEAPTDEEADSSNPEEWEEPTWVERAAKIMPSGTSTGSKRAATLYGDAVIDDEPVGPTHFARAHGCVVETLDGESFIDCTMALGSVAIGYGDERIARAAHQYVGEGNIAGLAPVIEVEVAE